MNTFNEVGSPNKQLDDFADQLEESVRLFLQQMIADGCSATDLRAASGYLSGIAHLAGSEAILKLQFQRRQEQLDAAPKLNQDEMGMAGTNETQAILMYKARTQQPLFVCKNEIHKFKNDPNYFTNEA